MNDDLKVEIHSLINSSKIFLFMKGTPDSPKCENSRRMVEVLKSMGSDYDYFDVTTDDYINKALQKESHCPTLPQLYIDGDMIGGCNITEKLFDYGELQKLIADGF